MEPIKIAVAGIGNCASALVQGIHYYWDRAPTDTAGVIRWDIGGYKPGDIEVAAAIDIDRRKVGKPLHHAIFAPPNCTRVFCPVPGESTVTVRMGPVLDGVPEHMREFDEDLRFLPADVPEPSKEEIVELFRSSGARILVNYLPVGAEKATRFYAECALEAGLAMLNNIPVFIASDEKWNRRFVEKNLPLIGDDIKSQLGATIVHRMLAELFKKRGVKLERTYQLNTGGNTDFLNMLDQKRLRDKKLSKTRSVLAAAGAALDAGDIHVGPSDYVAWQKDNKVCFIRMEGRIFGDVEIDLEMRLSVEDSPNSTGVVIDAIRCLKLALDSNMAGALEGPSACYCKHPPRQISDTQAFEAVDEFIRASAMPGRDIAN